MRGVVIMLALVCACASPPVPQEPSPVVAARDIADGDRKRRSGNLAGAEEAYRRALETDPDTVRAHVGLQGIEQARGRELAVRRRYRESADPFLRVRLDPAGPEQRAAFEQAAEPYRSMGLGVEAWGSGRPGAALDHFERARAIDPGHAWSRAALGRFYIAVGEWGAAQREFEAVLWTEPESPVAAYAMSVLAERRGAREASVAWARRAFKAASDQPSYGQRLKSLEERGTKEANPVVAEPLRKFVEAFADGVLARYRHYAATGEAESLDEFVDWARGLYERSTGRELGPKAEPVDFAFVGTIFDATEGAKEPLVRACADNGLLLVLAQRSGGPPEALLAHVLERKPSGPVTTRGMEVTREVVYLGKRLVNGYVEWAGGGDIAGLALYRLVLIDRPAIDDWEARIRGRIKRMAPYGAEILAEQGLAAEITTDLRDPAGVADRLRLAVGSGGGVREVEVHEDAHLVDAELHLPVGDHFFRNLGLAVVRGFSAEKILAYLERNAQLTAVAEAPSPRAALATCCEAMTGNGPHGRGYREIVDAMVKAIAARPADFPRIAPDRVIVQQLHRLTDDEVRGLASELMRRWGVQREDSAG
ncbi:MAG: tetratricopeptide repeat protein [Planctomycetota bacterium]|jgi:tetratricopeptide (TPR) repeat protein